MRLGAIAVSLADAGDEPLLEPAPGETPAVAGRAVARVVRAVRESHGARLRRLRSCSGSRPERHRRRARRGSRLGARMAQGLPADALRPSPVGRAGGPAPGRARPRSSSNSTRALHSAPGTHPTTALCLEWLDRRIRGGERVLDYGCGSGILALAALKLGAASAIGLRHRPAGHHGDPRKCGEERARVASRSRGTRRKRSPASYDVVLANILAGPLLALAPRLAQRARGRRRNRACRHARAPGRRR